MDRQLVTLRKTTIFKFAINQFTVDKIDGSSARGTECQKTRVKVIKDSYDVSLCNVRPILSPPVIFHLAIMQHEE
jgi:hypothetical protein